MAAPNGPSYIGLDRFKIVAALLVIAIHTGPLMSYNGYADFMLTGIAARLAVPYFFIVSGFFLFRKLTGDLGQDRRTLHRTVRKIGILYLVSILLYLPLNIYSGYFTDDFSFFSLLKDIVFDGTFYHLWYLPALMIGMYIVYYLTRIFSLRITLAATGILYAVGMLGDSYYGLIERSGILLDAYTSMFALFDYTRNGLFFAPLYLALGAWAAARPDSGRSAQASAACLAASLALMFGEGMLLRQLELPRHDSMYLFLVPAVYFLFRFLLLERPKNESGRGQTLRQISTWIYILHPIAIVFVRGAGKLTGLTSIVVGDSLIHYVCVALLSILLSLAAVRLLRFFAPKPVSRHRAWAEVDLARIAHNASELKRVLPPACDLMGVVKANAYGHGSVPVAKHLCGIGVKHFAVAEVDEGIALRKNGIKGEILVLGYTSPDRFADLARYRLSQTVISSDYGKALDEYGKPINVHIKIDTGMSRLGEHYSRMEQIYSMYRLRHVRIAGTFTHLSVSDSQEEQDIAFTDRQISRFMKTVEQLIRVGIDPGTLHIQSSYGILNYTDIHCGLARPGIALYGMLCNENDQVNADADLRPALSLRARVTLVKRLSEGEPVGYGRNYAAGRDCVIATVSIGYADGVPREWSRKGGYVLIRGQKAFIAGNICMDQLMVDVTGIDGVQEGDTATIIGQDGEEAIGAQQIAGRCGTIANEILTGIGSRVPRIYLNK